jgi:hypothetical protein
MLALAESKDPINPLRQPGLVESRDSLTGSELLHTPQPCENGAFIGCLCRGPPGRDLQGGHRIEGSDSKKPSNLLLELPGILGVCYPTSLDEFADGERRVENASSANVIPMGSIPRLGKAVACLDAKPHFR